MRSKILTTIAVAICLAAGMTRPLRAQGSALGPDPAEQLAGSQYSPQPPEDLRAELLNLVDAVQELAAFLPADLDSLQQARAQIEEMPAERLNALRAVINPARLQPALKRARTVIGKYSSTRPNMSTNTNITKMTLAPLPAAQGTFPIAIESCATFAGTTSANPDGTVSRLPTDVILAADLVWQTADTVRELAQDVCKQEVVVAGEGGNTSLACTVVDTVWIVAKFVDFDIHFCEDDLTGTLGDTSYLRLAFINDEIGDLQTGVNTITTNVSNVSTQISGQISGVDTHISTVDTHISNEIAALDAHMTALLAALSTQVANVQASVSLANQRLLKSLAVQTQVMKLELTPEGARIIAPSILTCTGSDCPTNLLANCTGPAGACTWNNVGPLP